MWPGMAIVGVIATLMYVVFFAIGPGEYLLWLMISFCILIKCQSEYANFDKTSYYNAYSLTFLMETYNRAYSLIFDWLTHWHFMKYTSDLS